MWHDREPGVDVVANITYSANFYAETTVKIIERRNKSRSLFLCGDRPSVFREKKKEK